VKGQTAGGT